MTTRHAFNIPGQFRLLERLGEGGTASVFKVTHERYDEPLALKLLDGLGDERSRQMFWHEVQALARLRHPHIINVVDIGITDEQPWLAMEFADGGALTEHSFDSWPRLKWAMQRILQALAHAHSRGIHHRDLKPQNIVVVNGMPKVTDFGIAYIREPHVDQTDTEEVTGTPAFMAPEQYTADWRSQGPATDLYSLGAVAWLWATGKLIFESDNIVAMMFKHVNDELPEFAPRFAVPRGFETWLRRSLEKKPRDRFAFARHALDALQALDESDMVGDEISSAASPEILPTKISEDDTIREAAPHSEELELSSDFGLSLFGLQEPPFVGRREELERLEALLERDSPTLVRISGAPGAGKSALLTAFVHRVHKRGLADVISVESVEGTSTLEVIASAIDYLFTTRGLSGRELREYLETRLECHGLDPDDLQRLLSRLVSIVSHDDDEVAKVQVSVALRAFSKLVELHAHQRPIVFTIDDAHRAGDMILVVQTLLELDAPLVVLMANDQEEAEARPVEALRLRNLFEASEFEDIVLEPLEPSELRRLVQEWLPLEKSAYEALVAFANNSPLIVNHTLLHWVKTGALERERRHYVVRDHEQSLPDSAAELWLQRLDELDEEFTDVRKMVTAAGVLGNVFRTDEWIRLCAQIDLVVTPQHLAALQNAGLVVPRARALTRGQYRGFGHERIRSDLLELSDDVDTLRRAAARVMVEHDDHFRAAHQLISVGDYDEAFENVMKASHVAFIRGDKDRMQGIVDWAKRWLRPDDLERRLRLGVQDCKATIKTDLNGAPDLVDQYVELARRHTPESLTMMLCRRALLWMIFESEASKTALDEAAELVTTVDDRVVLREYHETAGRIRVAQRRPKLAQRHLEWALKLSSDEDVWNRLSVHVDMVTCLILQEDLSGAVAVARMATELAREVGDVYLEAYVLSEGSAALVDLGEYEEARVWLERSLVLFDEIRAYNRDFSAISLILLDIRQKRDFDSARSRFESLGQTNSTPEFKRWSALARLAVDLGDPDADHANSLDAYVERIGDAHQVEREAMRDYLRLCERVAVERGLDEPAARLQKILDSNAQK